MDKNTIVYRGSLKSCNYHCSYCPFSKNKMSDRELEKDRECWTTFCESVRERVDAFSIGAVFVTPYGEALIHHWYWEGLACLSRLDKIDKVGVQTNASFAVEKFLKIYMDLGGKVEKLCIWATFHPEMTDIDSFVAQCNRLVEKKVHLSAGAVGVPENIEIIKQLRDKLPKSIYLWINKMDGLKRKYTIDELNTFIKIDPFFINELNYPKAFSSMCKNRCFVEADGQLHSCNISNIKPVNWYEGTKEDIFNPLCHSKRCSCYLAYSGRTDFHSKNFFGSYPIFRVPKKPKAIFFDLDGTLFDKGSKNGLSLETYQYLMALKNDFPLFFATSMPREEVIRRLKESVHLFQGGIIASGAYLYLNNENGLKLNYYPVKVNDLLKLQQFLKKVKARFQFYKINGIIYKVTLIKNCRFTWNDDECALIRAFFKESECRFFVENHCLQIVAKDRNKGTGILEICSWLGISAKDVLSVGNDKEDIAMEDVCGAYVKIHRY